LGRGNGAFGSGGLLECIRSGPTRISLEPWYPLWYPILVISIPTIIFTQKSLSYFFTPLEQIFMPMLGYSKNAI
jgi:hypothetical protein